MGPQLRTGSHGALSAPPHSVPQLPMVSHKVPSPIWLDWRLFTELVSTDWGPGSLVLVRQESNCKPAAGPSRRFLSDQWGMSSPLPLRPHLDFSLQERIKASHFCLWEPLCSQGRLKEATCLLTCRDAANPTRSPRCLKTGIQQ